MKKRSSKLTLSKETIVTLVARHLQGVAGGGPSCDFSCADCSTDTTDPSVASQACTHFQK
jgi:hypothetical protein